MCDYSLHNARTRPAAAGDKLITHRFLTGTAGFTPVDEHYTAAEGPTAVCLLPGTEIAFEDGRVAVFKKIHTHEPMSHHDALEFPSRQQVLLNNLKPGMRATVLQLPAKVPWPNKAEIEEIYRQQPALASNAELDEIRRQIQPQPQP